MKDICMILMEHWEYPEAEKIFVNPEGANELLTI